jgi:squalene-hopene/tetraprenyl-beta-curcumene cyclase
MPTISRRTFLLTATAAAGCSRRADESPLQRAARYLWKQQSEDGGFHSTTYGLLRSGQSLTPFVLGALLEVPETIRPVPWDAVDRALEFIRKNTNADGALGHMNEPAADYPNYATSLAVAAFVKARRSGWNRDVAKMAMQLRAQQFSETNGWKPEDPPYGGWGMGGPIHRPPDAGHVDLSMTRCVLEALRDSGVPANDPAMLRALRYLERSQNSDGGFYFSTVNLDTNKAGESDGKVASYGTATADGVLSLRAAGIPDSDQRIARAVKWLNDNHQPDRVPGFRTKPRELWGAGLRFYYADAISRAVPGLPVQLPAQSGDGSYRNPNNMVKEDDPLIATAFAVRVLVRQTA